MSVDTKPAPSANATPARFSFVLEHPPADPAEARRHFLARLSVETDPADVHTDLERGTAKLVVIDVRGPKAYEQCHIRGAISLPYRTMNEETTADLPRDAVMVVYCWSPACNAATRGAARLAELGFRVKEMIGGIEYWRREGYPVEGALGESAPLYG